MLNKNLNGLLFILNDNFKLVKSCEFKNDLSAHSFAMDPSILIKLINVIGFISRREKYDEKILTNL